MAEHARHARQRLLTWFSPAFPIGSFAWSGGLERAIHDRLVVDRTGLHAWLLDLLAHGSWRNDAILMVEAFRAFEDATRLSDLTDLAASLTPSAERRVETLALGRAFLLAQAAWPDPVLARLGEEPAYPVALGAVSAAHGLGSTEMLTAWLTAQTAQAVSVAIRLGILGQTDGLLIQAALEDPIAVAAGRLALLGEHDLGGAAILADIAAMNHEVQISRLFRS